MKKVLSIALIVMVLGSLSAAVFAGEKYKDGSFIVFQADSKSDLVVDFKFKNDMVVGVEILNPIKNAATYKHEGGIKAFNEFPSQVLANQAAGVDAVTGATGSYNSYNEAVKTAFEIASKNYDGNVFYGVARDYGHGHTVLKVTVDKAANKIVSVEHMPAQSNQPRETREADKPATGYPLKVAIDAYQSIPAQIVKEQSITVDVVAGATHSSHAYMEAVKHALEQAGMDPDKFVK